jgi:SHS family lactate transporter-like MFS transporter
MADHYATDEKVASTGSDGPVESHAPHSMTVGEYAATRFSTLKPPMHKAPNPLRLLAMLSGKQWLFFLIGFIAWVSLFLHHDITVSLIPSVLGRLRFLHCQFDGF